VTLKRRFLPLAAVTISMCGVLAALLFARRHRDSAKAIEPAYLLLAQALVAAGRPDLATRVKQGCMSAPDLCSCAVLGGSAALDADHSADALDFLEKAGPKCARPRALDGVRAEALARAERFDEAGRLAEATSIAAPSDANAQLALAQLACHSNQMTKCRESAEKALSLGRGTEADRLIGRTFLAQGEFQRAREHFRRVLEAAPRDLEAAFTAAVCSDRLGQYHDAREGFLRVLQIDPKHVQARVQLIALTANVGALDEARHHQSKLEALLPPNDPLVLTTREWLEKAAETSTPSISAQPRKPEPGSSSKP
jgi:tetratricopeptide (TPR) repeat protein